MLKQKIQRDSLTHLYNLEAGKYLANDYIKNFPSNKHALIVLDVDHFKSVNDTFASWHTPPSPYYNSII